MAKVLLIEDDHIVQHVHSRMIIKLGHEVTVCGLAKEALTILKKSRVHDIILVDIGLPDMNGFELIAKIREKEASIPIIALTGYISQSDNTECLAAGASAIMHKPIMGDELKNNLEKYLIKI